VSQPHVATDFSLIFDHAVAACARAQILVARCTETAARARTTRVSARRTRSLAQETRAAWADADAMLEAMRREVEAVAGAMRKSGVSRDAAAAAVRAHVRFVLYDGGLREDESEPVVERASVWVEMFYAAA
jgi:hypothetical protein